jgi:antitoxin CptB
VAAPRSEGEDRVKKLRWKSRRGLKELDVLFEAFFARQAETLAAGGWPQLEELLAQEDDVLFDWVSGRDLPSDPGLLNLIERLIHGR